MIYDVELFLFVLILISAGIMCFDFAVLARSRAKGAKLPIAVDYAKSFFPILILVLVLRSFLYEPFRIPSGSLEPTLLIGDYIVVNKYKYGLRLPVIHTKLFNIAEPTNGDIIVFRWPPDEHIDYIKRVIGKPGDHIQYNNKILRINGIEAKQDFIGYETVIDETGGSRKVEKRQETINGVKHNIYIHPEQADPDVDLVVPAGHYFVLGDNRDDSSDSRFWGFVPEANIVGRADAVWMSWDFYLSNIRWGRIGRTIY